MKNQLLSHQVSQFLDFILFKKETFISNNARNLEKLKIQRFDFCFSNTHSIY